MRRNRTTATRLQIEKAKLDILRARRELANMQAKAEVTEEHGPAAMTDDPDARALRRMRTQEAALRIARQRAELTKALSVQHEDQLPAHPPDPSTTAFDRLKLRQLTAQVRLTEEKARQASAEAARASSSASADAASSRRPELTRAQLAADMREQLALKRGQLELQMKQYEFEQQQLKAVHEGEQVPAPDAARIAYERQKQRMDLQRMAIELRVAERKAALALAGPTSAAQQAERLLRRQDELKMRKDLIALQTEQMRAIAARRAAAYANQFEQQRLDLDRQKLDLERKRAEADIARLGAIDPKKQGEKEMLMLQMQADKAKTELATANARLTELEQLEGSKRAQALQDIQQRALRNEQEKIRLQAARDAQHSTRPREGELRTLGNLLAMTDSTTGRAAGRAEFRNLLDRIRIGDLGSPLMLQNFITERFFAVLSDVLSNVNARSGARRIQMRDVIEDVALQDAATRLLVAQFNAKRRANTNVGTTTALEASSITAGHALDGFITWLTERFGRSQDPNARRISPYLRLDGRTPTPRRPILLATGDQERARMQISHFAQTHPGQPLVFLPTQSFAMSAL